MAITFFKEKKKQKYLIYILIAITVAIFLIIWLGILKKPQTAPEQIVPSGVSENWQKIEINFQILENPLFQNLKDFEKIPNFDGQVGRENPFIPF
jgi:hypothetical protein